MVTIAFVFAALTSPFVWWLTRTSPLAAFRQPARVWLLTVGSLAGYHACIYYATQQAPPAAAALLQGTTPLMIVLGSALLPGERLRWWHMVGTSLGLCGVLLLIENGSQTAAASPNAAFHLSLIGAAAGLWGLYSVASRSLPETPSSTLGVFYAACAVVLACAHLLLETWVAPSREEWAAMTALGVVPMGLAIYLWDYGVKRGASRPWAPSPMLSRSSARCSWRSSPTGCSDGTCFGRAFWCSAAPHFPPSAYGADRQSPRWPTWIVRRGSNA
jgi:drug/metabolite transporter (DMT)-like permease